MTLTDLLVQVVGEAYAASQHRGTSSALLKDPDAPATAVYLCARNLLGPELIHFEPETLWLSLDVAPANRDKLLAAVTVDTTPSFYDDYRVFGHTCLALNGENTLPENMPKPSVSQMAWAVLEAELIFSLDGNGVRPEPDDEVTQFVALSLFHEGFVKAPPTLSFAEAELRRQLRSSESSPDAEAARQETVEVYLVSQLSKLQGALAKL